MARYIDADKLCEGLKDMARYQEPYKQSTILGVVSTIENTPTADVVPKSEADKWYYEYHAIKDELKQEKVYHSETDKLADRYCAELQTAKSEVELLAKEVDRLSQVVLYHESVTEMKVSEAKDEVASKIFADLEAKAPWFCENQTAYEHFNEELAELKKKYTEDKT